MVTLIRQTVEDYGKWRVFFDQRADTRREAGVRSAQVLRSAENPNDVAIILQWEDKDRATQFLGSDHLRNLRGQGGVIGEPQVTFFQDEGFSPS